MSIWKHHPVGWKPKKRAVPEGERAIPAFAFALIALVAEVALALAHLIL